MSEAAAEAGGATQAPAEVGSGDEVTTEQTSAPEGAQGGGEPASQAQADAAAEALEGAEEQETPEGAPRKWTIKVNGQEKEVGEEEMIRLAQMADGANARFKEAAELRKQAQAKEEQMSGLLAALKGDMFGTLEQLGFDTYGAAEAYFAQKLAYEQMDPNERRKLELDRREQNLRSEEEKRRRSAEEAQLAQAAQEYEKRFTADLAAALDKAGVTGLDRADYIPRAAAMMDATLNDDGTPGMTIDEIAAAIAEQEQARRGRFRESTMGELEALEGSALLGALPKGLQKKIREAIIAEAKAPAPRSAPMTPPPKRAAPPQKRVIRDVDDLRRFREES